MKLLPIAAALALGFASAALAQTQPPTTASNPAAAEAKFKAADTNKNGSLEDAELTAFKSAMAQVDTNKDGKLSQAEFEAGVKAGHIK